MYTVHTNLPTIEKIQENRKTYQMSEELQLKFYLLGPQNRLLLYLCILALNTEIISFQY